mmetsp:Transcript_2180/g.3636  ORF Transcript_2180/g.3636 Transcript_2180/m.3636 type:complete len:361 (-) Transcript_2180:116-1198(-)
MIHTKLILFVFALIVSFTNAQVKNADLEGCWLTPPGARNKAHQEIYIDISANQLNHFLRWTYLTDFANSSVRHDSLIRVDGEDRQFSKNIWSFNVTLNFGDKSSGIQPIKLTYDFKFLSKDKLNGTEINGGKSTEIEWVRFVNNQPAKRCKPPTLPPTPTPTPKPTPKPTPEPTPQPVYTLPPPFATTLIEAQPNDTSSLSATTPSSVDISTSPVPLDMIITTEVVATPSSSDTTGVVLIAVAAFVAGVFCILMLLTIVFLWKRNHKDADSQATTMNDVGGSVATDQMGSKFESPSLNQYAAIHTPSVNQYAAVHTTGPNDEYQDVEAIMSQARYSAIPSDVKPEQAEHYATIGVDTNHL